MRDSDIKPDTAGETRSDPIINPASNAPAVRGRCRVGSRFLCALVALSPAILSPQYTQAGAPPQPIADVVAKVKAAVVEVVVVRPKDDSRSPPCRTSCQLSCGPNLAAPPAPPFRWRRRWTMNCQISAAALLFLPARKLSFGSKSRCLCRFPMQPFCALSHASVRW
jgi:hypothetical protein